MTKYDFSFLISFFFFLRNENGFSCKVVTTTFWIKKKGSGYKYMRTQNKMLI